MTSPTGALRYVDPHARRGVFYRVWARLVGTRFMGWLSRMLAWRLDPVLHRLTRGRLSFAWPLPTSLLETTGARTGQPRRNVVIYFHDGDDVVVVPSKAGAPEHPAWYHNAVAHPEVTFGGVPLRAVAVEAAGERERLWELADRVFPSYAVYRERAERAGRTIPLVKLVAR